MKALWRLSGFSLHLISQSLLYLEFLALFHLTFCERCESSLVFYNLLHTGDCNFLSFYAQQCAVCNTQYTVCSVDVSNVSVCSVQCAVCGVCSAECVRCSVWWGLCGVQCMLCAVFTVCCAVGSSFSAHSIHFETQ